MVGVVAVMYLLGGVLPILGIGQAVRDAKRRHKKLDADLRMIDEIGHRPESISIDNHEATQKAMRAVREPQLRYYYRLEYAFEFAERELLASLKKPGYLAGAGVLMGMLGSLLSLTL